MSCDVESLCFNLIDDQWWGVGVDIVVLVYAFIGVAIVADSHLVPGLETLCVRWGIPEDVAGASFMAFGSAAPEITINAISTIKAVLSGAGPEDDAGDDAALGVGAILGSGMIAFTAIPGLCGLCVPAGRTLELKRRPLARDLGAYVLSLLWLCACFQDGVITLHESSVMLLMYAAYMSVVVCAAGVRQRYRRVVLKKATRRQQSFVHAKGIEINIEIDPGRAAPSALNQMQQPLLPRLDTAAAAALPAAAAAAALPAAPPPWWRRVSTATVAVVMSPLEAVLAATCPPCEHDSPHARRYPITLASAFLWLTFFSLLISTTVSRLGAICGIPQAFLGMYVVAIGAEIPDTIQSVTVARRGYGSMAVSNSCGSQIINILVGLGLPWFITNAAGSPIEIKGHGDLQLMSLLQGGNLLVFFVLLLLATAHTWRPGDHRKATLGRAKGAVLLGTYVLCIGGYPLAHQFW